MSVDSPCIGLCQILPDRDVCRGCYRTLAEITEWRSLPDDKRRHILAQLESRKKAEAEKLLST